MGPGSNSVIDVINWGRELFLRRSIPHARYNIEILLGHVLEKRRAELYCDYNYLLSPSELERVRGYVEKRLNHWPLWHIVGRVEFFGIELSVDSRVLIPRPETEVLVEAALRELSAKPREGVRYIADIGTGSGNIAIALAKGHAGVFIYATDISSDALEIAEANARASGADGAISFLKGDLLEPFEQLGGGSLEMILSNPPYISSREWEELPLEVREREPRIALYGGRDGLDLIRELVARAPCVLEPGGHLMLEVGSGQAGAVRAMADMSGRYASVAVYRDYAGVDRLVHAVACEG